MDAKGFLGSVFDFSFTHFVTTSIIKFIFILLMIFAGLAALAFIGIGFKQGTGTGFVFLLLAPVIFFIYVVFARIWCEIIIVLFRIAENTGRIPGQSKSAIQ